MIYQIEHEAKQGLGGSLQGQLKRYFTVAMKQKRVFLLTGQYDWAQGHSYCDGFDAMECFFLPISKCNPKDIISQVKDSNDYYEGKAPDNCTFGTNDKHGRLPKCEWRVIHITKKVRYYVMNNGDIFDWTKDKFGLGMMGFSALITQYFLRPKPEIRKIIYDKISKSIYKSFNGDIPNILHTGQIIAYPIRASDKCKAVTDITGKHYTHHAEANCFTPEEHIKVMNAFNYLTNYKQWTLILTSEDNKFLDMVIKLMYDTSISNVSNWRYIRNTEDFSVGEGTTTYKGTLRKFKDQKLDERTGSSLETDHIVSALSSLIFQVHLEPKYIVYGDSSTWLKLMWKFLNYMNCNIKPEYHRDVNDAKCVELCTPGYLKYYGDFPYKFVKFSHNLWQRIHNENLKPKRFEQEFGINITQYGWDRWCEKDFKKKIKY